MHDPLEQFLKDNKEDIFQVEGNLSPEHKQSFEERLLQQNQQVFTKKEAPRFKVWNIAAIFIVAIGLSTAFFFIGRGSSALDDQPPRLALNEVSKSLGEVEYYYANALANEEKSLQGDLKSEEVLKGYFESIKALEKQYLKLEEQLAMNPKSQVIIDAMLDNYRKRIEILKKLKMQNQRISKFTPNENASS